MTWPGHPLLLVGMAAWLGAFGAWALLAHSVPPPLLAAFLGCLVLCAVWQLWCNAASAAVLGLLVCGLVVGTVASWTYLAGSRPPQIRGMAEASEQVDVVGTVRASAPLRSGSGTRVTLAVRGIHGPQHRSDARTSAVLIDRTGRLGLPARGSQLRVSGRLLPLDPWREPGIAVVVSQVLQRAPPDGVAGSVAAARDRMWITLSGSEPDASALIAGLSVGDDSRQSEELAASMRSSGLAHLTAVSGGNVAIVTGSVLLVVSRLGAPLWLRILSALVAAAAYAVFVGPEPSVLRASAMGCVALVGVFRTTRGGGPSALGAAVLGLLVVSPGLAVSWGFALSVSATAGILLLAARCDRLWVRWIDPLPRIVSLAAAACSVTVAAQLATAPLLAAMTGEVSVVGLPANVLAAPLVVPITLLGLLIVLTASPAPGLAVAVAVLAEPFGRLLATIAHTAAAVPWATVEVGMVPMTLGSGLAIAALSAASARWGVDAPTGRESGVP